MDSSIYSQPLRGRVALITGAGQGIGLATAREFVAQGAKVVATGLDAAQLDGVRAELGDAAATTIADVRSESSMTAAFRHGIDAFGHVDVVIANAVVGDSNPIGKITEAQFANIFDTNVKGVLNTVQPAVDLLPRGASVVIVGSTASVKGGYGMSLYGGAKAAIRSMVRTWILELQGRGIRVNVLSPGAVDTPSLRSALADAVGEDRVEATVADMGEKSPLGRLLQPRDIALSIAFLASEASCAITGVELFADGGLAQI